MVIHIVATHVGITHCREQREKGWNEEWERVQQIIHELLVLQTTGGGWVWHERLDNMMYIYTCVNASSRKGIEAHFLIF